MFKITLTTVKPLVAIVDDEVEITQILADELSDKYEVMTFNSPREFLHIIKNNKIVPSVLVSDLKMPGMTGLEMLTELSKIGFKTPTILFSGYLEKKDAILAMELGVVHILEKPVDVYRVHDVVDATFVDFELMRTRSEIKTLISQLHEFYSSFRLTLVNYVPEEIANKVLFAPVNTNNSNGENIGVVPTSFEEVLSQLESKLSILLKEEDGLEKKKDADHFTRSA